MQGLIFLLFILVCMIAITAWSMCNVSKNNDVVSFKEAMDLTGFPVITFYIGEEKLNFLLDTGSNVSYINKKAVANIPHTLLEKCTTVTGLGDIQEMQRFCEIEFYYKHKNFKDEFCMVDLDASFEAIKAESGVVLHGLLGSKFFQKYRYVLNFDELIAYSNK